MSGNEKNHYQLVKVFLRPRPLTTDEMQLRIPSVIDTINNEEIVIRSGSILKKYGFDRVFTDKTSQNEVFNVVVQPLIDYVISGYNCTVFAYGQTGTGKTHTMIGTDIGPNTDFDYDPSVGMIPRAAVQLFQHLNGLNEKIEYAVSISFLEIYNEEVRDLLNGDHTPLRIFDDPDNRGSICIKGLIEPTVYNVTQVYEWLNIGTIERQTASTNLNRHSSRSHTLFTLIVHTREMTAEGEELIKTGKLHLVDLAGSENIGRSGATDLRAREAGTINKSLLTLGKVIKALAQKMQHIPYRDSKLTRILQDSLGGNTKTCMIATISPCVNAWDETASTLDYAHVARRVANCPRANVNRKQTSVLNELTGEIAKLRQELTAARTGSGFYMSQQSYRKMSEDVQVTDQRVKALLQQIQSLEEFKRMKEQQYEKLNESFNSTKSYLDAISQELETKKTKEKQNEHMINYMKRRNHELNAAVNSLLDICKMCTKRGEIFYTKYDSQCSSTLNNANIAKCICATTLNYLKEIKHNSEISAKNRELYSNEIREKISHLKDCNLKNLEQLKQLQFKLESEMTDYNLNFENIIKNDDSNYSEDGFQNYFSFSFDYNCSTQVESLKKIKEFIEDLKNHIVLKNAEMELKSSHCFRSIEDEYFALIISFSNNLLGQIKETIKQIEKQFCRKNEQKRLIEQYLIITEQEEEDLLKELQSLDKMDDQINTLMDKYEDEKPLSRMKDALVDYKECQIETVKTQLLMVENVVGAVEENEIAYHKQITFDKSKTQQYISGFIETIENNLNRYSRDLKNSVGNWVKQISVIKENLLTPIIKHRKDIDENIENVSNNDKACKNGIEKIMQQASSNLQGTENKIINKAHVGDTPVKIVYKLPKKIESKLSSQDLLKRLENGDCSASESE